MVSDHDFYSLRTHRAWRTRRKRKPLSARLCPLCEAMVPAGEALAHMRERHPNAYSVFARRRGGLI